jgi:serine/threonine protein kinase
VTSAADVYALGLVLVELLTGSPDRSARVDGPIGATIARCLARDPRLRPSAGELERELGGERSSAPTTILRRRRTTRGPVLLAGAATITIAAGIAAAIASSGGPSHPTPPPARIAAVPNAPTARQQAQDIATWLLRYSR